MIHRHLSAFSQLLAAWAVALVVLTTAAAQPAHAVGVEAYTHLSISNFRFYLDAGGGTPGAAVTLGTDVNVTAATTASRADGLVSSISAVPASTSNSSVFTSAGLDTLQAYQGGAPTPAENNFTNVNSPASVPFGRGDTGGSGVPIAGVPGESFGAAVDLVSHAQLSSNPFTTDSAIGAAAADIRGTFSLTGTAPLNLLVTFDAALDLFTDLSAVPPASAAGASVGTSIIISGDDLHFIFSPKGTGAGSAIGGVKYADPFSLNQVLSGTLGNTDPLTFGPATFSAGFTVQPSQEYTFTIAFGSVVAAATEAAPPAGATPEPASLSLVAAALSILALTTRRPHLTRRSPH